MNPLVSDDIVGESSLCMHQLRLSHDGPSTSSWCHLGGNCTQFFCLRIKGKTRMCVIGERERANLVVRSSGIFCLYIYIYICRRRTSCKCACAASNALLLNFQFFTHFHTLPLAICADRSSQPENSPPFDGMRCNLR